MDKKEYEKKIVGEIQNLTPYLTELQEYKENGLFLPEGASNKDNVTPIFDEHGKRIDSKKKTNAQIRADLRNLATKLRVLTINKHLDDEMGMLFPKLAIKVIRKWPQLRPLVMALMFTSVSIVHRDRPKPFGSDIVTIKSFWIIYSEVNFVWEK